MTYEELLTETALGDDRFIVMTAENRALIRNLPGKLGKRFIDTGITEQTMIGAASGLALRGRIPVVHALASFLTMRAFEFVRTDAGIANLPVKLSSFVPGFLSDGNGPTHQAIEDVALMRGIPNMTVFAPADEQDLVGMLPQIWNHPAPSYVRINTRKTDYEHSPFEIGKAEVISKGEDVTILTYGLLFEQALIAAEILKGEGISVGLVNMRSLKPVDEQAIIDAVRGSALTVTLEDHFVTGGLYSIVAETLLKNEISGKVVPFALNERWFKPALLPNVLAHEGFTGKQIAEKILGHSTRSVQPEVSVPQFSE
ncbi:MAG TPA: transketolase C-terminal domain-containing protein [Mucilaginibacter sp.]|nr:transketolase C-terminal domain-containing protein [Mucilaginibacter sp.]